MSTHSKIGTATRYYDNILEDRLSSAYAQGEYFDEHRMQFDRNSGTSSARNLWTNPVQRGYTVSGPISQSSQSAAQPVGLPDNMSTNPRSSGNLPADYSVLGEDPRNLNVDFSKDYDTFVQSAAQDVRPSLQKTRSSHQMSMPVYSDNKSDEPQAEVGSLIDL